MLQLMLKYRCEVQDTPPKGNEKCTKEKEEMLCSICDEGSPTPQKVCTDFEIFRIYPDFTDFKISLISRDFIDFMGFYQQNISKLVST